MDNNNKRLFPLSFFSFLFSLPFHGIDSSMVEKVKSIICNVVLELRVI